ncbi:MAG: hypothetical protein H2038_04860 [Brevundimonas sp.]|uniref:hypothetical protein n=1 Tax=Brevundimonas sp. TaxID=1871086 RepID=UPI0018115F4D|nr:hypothetical protein [Brevundimonas sp.]MBA4803965.1 hypothetical protein [Brevundimonas sp.]
MTSPLQAKDDQWRKRRANASVPVFDPGMSPPGTDAEAGGAPAAGGGQAGRTETGEGRRPLPIIPEGETGGGLRAPPKVWYAIAVAVALLFALVAAISVFR